jgi:hypothetical protein
MSRDIEGFDIDKEVQFVGGRMRRKGSAPAQNAEDFALH